jgi:ABC-type histidine transport system ATPase subunit
VGKNPSNLCPKRLILHCEELRVRHIHLRTKNKPMVKDSILSINRGDLLKIMGLLGNFRTTRVWLRAIKLKTQPTSELPIRFRINWKLRHKELDFLVKLGIKILNFKEINPFSHIKMIEVVPDKSMIGLINNILKEIWLLVIIHFLQECQEAR